VAEPDFPAIIIYQEKIQDSGKNRQEEPIHDKQKDGPGTEQAGQ
jgi:hypothetical protein